MKFNTWLAIIIVFVCTHALSIYLCNIHVKSRELNFRADSFIENQNTYFDFMYYMESKGIDAKDLTEFGMDFNSKILHDLNIIGLNLSQNNNRMDPQKLLMLRIIYQSKNVQNLVKANIKECSVSKWSGVCYLEMYFEQLKKNRVDENFFNEISPKERKITGVTL